MRFLPDGAERLDSIASPVIGAIMDMVASQPEARPGLRLHGVAGLSELLGPAGVVGQSVAAVAAGEMSPVRAILFDKNTLTNWALGWHQDRTICVRERRDVAGFGPWTVKAGLLHVAPPFELLARMVTVRIHLDDVPLDNAPLLIAPGSHRFGLVREDRIEAVVAECGVRACAALAGDVWVYSTPILHASDAAATPGRRRVLQVDYAGLGLPGGLEWSGI